MELCPKSGYLVWDTKLARSPKPYFVIQLCAYSEMIAQLTGTLPDRFGMILGSKERVGHKDGVGKFEGAIVWVCQLQNGMTFDVVPVGTISDATQKPGKHERSAATQPQGLERERLGGWLEG